MAGTTGSKAMSAQVKPLYPKPKRKARPWSSQNKTPKKR
jgi:hypothetical protein